MCVIVNDKKSVISANDFDYFFEKGFKNFQPVQIDRKGS
jgi:hypothetical protein